MELRGLLSQRLNVDDVKRLAGAPDAVARMLVYIGDADDRTAVNALWVLTHTPRSTELPVEKLVDLLLTARHPARKRMLLTLLERQRPDAGRTSPDFLDWCFAHINAATEPYAVRALCVKCAYSQCRRYPELVGELLQYLDMMGAQQLSPGLRSVLKNTRNKIAQ